MMDSENKSCPLCHSGTGKDYIRVRDFFLSGESFSLLKCSNCGFVYTAGVPAPNEIGKYYKSDEYVSHSDTRKGVMNRLYHTARSIMLYLKFRMVRNESEGDRLLDIGCGTGYFPAYMQRRGFGVNGVEVDPAAAQFARKTFGLNVATPAEFLNREIQGYFDIITLWHVLEHLDDFDLYIDRMLEYLLPGGLLVIALPNCSSPDARHYKEFWAGYDVPRHLWHFTPSTFKVLADKHHLKIIKMKRLPLDPFYNSMLSEKYRKSRFFMIKGMIIGKLAYLESLFSLKKSSSVVYFLKRKSDS
jgi:2-polyprenyl-3-methyl-5-hydroxy-6-metoxy-1,4-benzoquinol methylase